MVTAKKDRVIPFFRKSFLFLLALYLLRMNKPKILKVVMSTASEKTIGVY
jgi:hypothetical protein